jgi:hypothetical protein
MLSIEDTDLYMAGYMQHAHEKHKGEVSNRKVTPSVSIACSDPKVDFMTHPFDAYLRATVVSVS